MVVQVDVASDLFGGAHPERHVDDSRMQEREGEGRGWQCGVELGANVGQGLRALQQPFRGRGVVVGGFRSRVVRRQQS